MARDDREGIRMSARGHQGLLLAGQSPFLGLMAILAPISWLRLSDNAANNTVTDSSKSPSNGSLFEVLTTTTQTAVNTNTRANAGMLTGDSDGCFNFAATSMITVPNKTLSNTSGWTAFCLINPTSAPPSLSNNVGAIFQFGNSGTLSNAPELDIYSNGNGTFRFRPMLSGVSEIPMSASPSWPWGTKLAVAFKKEANGNAKLFVSGALVATSTSAPGYSYGTDVMRWGAAKFANPPWYQFPGLMDELAIFNSPLSDANCLQLTALAAA